MARFTSRPMVLAALASTVALTACATPTPYKPVQSNSRYATGFFDRQIENNRFVVTFAGNSVTSRERVERYLLFRAAELTLQNGADYFSVVDRDTERKTDTQVTNFGGGFGGGWGGYGYWGPGWGYWGPQWRFARRGYGWGGWGGWGGGWGADPFFNDVQVRQIDRYEAQAEIITGRGAKPAGDRFAFNAREVVERLGPTIEYPGDRRR